MRQLAKDYWNYGTGFSKACLVGTVLAILGVGFWFVSSFGEASQSTFFLHLYFCSFFVLFVPGVLVPLFTRIPVDNMLSVWFKAIMFVLYVVSAALYSVAALQIATENMVRDATGASNGTQTCVRILREKLPSATDQTGTKAGLLNADDPKLVAFDCVSTLANLTPIQKVYVHINGVWTDIAFHLLAAIVVLIGIWINSKRGDFQRRNEQTFRMMVDSRLSEAFLDKLSEFDAGISVGHPVQDCEARSFKNKSMRDLENEFREAQDDSTKDELYLTETFGSADLEYVLTRKKAYNAARYLLNYYEFLARGLLEGELTESMSHSLLPGIVRNIAIAGYAMVAVDREDPERGDKVFKDFLWLLHRWDLVGQIRKKDSNADYSQMVEAVIQERVELQSKYVRKREPVRVTHG